MPTAYDWNDPLFRSLIDWRFDRWTAVHERLRDAVRSRNPRAEVGHTGNVQSKMAGSAAFTTAVDWPRLGESLDVLSTDPYYTLHASLIPFFRPQLTYVGEWSRYLTACAGTHARSVLIAQGFDPPAAATHMPPEAGVWYAAIPPAAGVSTTTAFTYPAQAAGRTQETYERCFALDRYFERVRPVRYAAVVNSMQTETWDQHTPWAGPGTYDVRRFLPACNMLRDGGVPYAHLPDRHLTEAGLDGYRVVLLPWVTCLSDVQAAALEAFVRRGGLLITLGPCGTHDKQGSRRVQPALAHVLGVRCEEGNDGALLTGSAETMLSDSGRPRVAWSLDEACRLQADEGVTVLASHQVDGAAAITLRKLDKGRALCVGGWPTRNVTLGLVSGYAPFNEAWRLVSAACVQLAPPPVIWRGFPPVTPYMRVRTTDSRAIPTMEHFLLEGDGVLMSCLGSYAGEAGSFTGFVPRHVGRIRQVRELLHERVIAHETADDGDAFPIDVHKTDPFLAYWIELT